MADDKDIKNEEKTQQNAAGKPTEGKEKKRRVWVAPKLKETKEKEEKEILPNTPISDAALEKLARLMNDSPTRKKLHGTEWEIHALKPGAQWLIAEEACKIVKEDNMAMGDVIKQFATNLPAVCRCLTIALLNDKEKIYGEEYQLVYDTLMWGDYEMKDWATLLFEIVSLVDVNFFFASTGAIQTVRGILNRKTTKAERTSYPPVQNGGR